MSERRRTERGLWLCVIAAAGVRAGAADGAGDPIIEVGKLWGEEGADWVVLQGIWGCVLGIRLRWSLLWWSFWF